MLIPCPSSGPNDQQSLLASCLDDLRVVLDSRKDTVTILQHVVDTDALMTVDHPQVTSRLMVTVTGKGKGHSNSVFNINLC